MSADDRFRALFSDLGKATLRGVKKCPKCGTYNGSRGLCCKNKHCNAVFKEPGERRKLSPEACKLITGSTAQVFSVRVRDKGPDYRGFVQLPLNPTMLNDTMISQSTALCFVDSCERSFDTSVLKCHEKDLSDITIPMCQHIQAALRYYAEAQPLTLKNSILSTLNVSNEIKQEIWLLATETSGPLVQRISKNIMAVKCKASPKHPLGYLHFSFYTTKLKDKIEHRYSCSCATFKAHPRSADEHKRNEVQAQNRCAHFYACICAFASDPKLADEFDYYINLDEMELRVDTTQNLMVQNNDTDNIIRMVSDLDCLTDDTHLLIFRDDTLTVQNLDGERLDIDCINLDPTILTNSIIDGIDVDCQERSQLPSLPNLLEDNNVISQLNDSCTDINESTPIIDEQALKILNDQSGTNTKYNLVDSTDYLLDDNTIRVVNNGAIKVFDTQTLLDATNIGLLDSNDSTMNNNGIKFIGDGGPMQYNAEMIQVDNLQPIATKRKRDGKLRPSNLNLNLNNLNSIETRRGKARPSILKKPDNSCGNLDETNTNLSFTKWLASITERINQTMHFQFDGRPEPLVFHVPQTFFDCLRERISCGSKKKRLPNSTTAFVRKDGVPLGTFTKYTWQITNILHVKSIFETTLIPLEITRSFIQNADGTYELYKREETEIDKYKKTGNSTLIKPLELKTFLKVGNTSPNQVEPTPFLIEWIPDILPISKIGELRIRFEFGHVKNDSPDKCRKIALSRNS